MKTVPIKQLRQKDGETAIADMNHRRYSLLDSVGCHSIRAEMKVPGILANWVGRAIFYKADKTGKQFWDQRARYELAKLFAWGAPAKIRGKMPQKDHGLVIGFNHPSLGEILRLITFTIERCPNLPMIFPVSLPWYEALCPIVGQLNDAGVILTPIIPTILIEKMQDANPDLDLPLINSLCGEFESIYLKLCRKYVGRSVILVAPSARRQRYVFASKKMLLGEAKITPATMSLLATILGRKNISVATSLLSRLSRPKILIDA